MTGDTAFWAIALLASVSVGLSKGGLPVIGMMSVPLLALKVPPLAAAGLLLPVYIVSDIVGLVAYRREFDKRVLMILIPATTLGITFGWAVASQVPEWLISGLIGTIGAAFAINLIFRPLAPGATRPAKWGAGLIWGAIAGFTSFVSHSGGPPYQVYVLPLRLSKTVFAGTSTILFAYVNAVKLAPYWALGQLSIGNLKVAALLALPACLAVLAGVRLVKVLPEALFFRLVTWALLAVSLKLIWSSLSG